MVPSSPAEVLAAWLPAWLDGRRAPATLYADEVTVWHNIGEREQRLDQPPSFGRLRAALPDVQHADVKTHVTPSGFVVQATTVAALPDGSVVRVPACLVVTVEEGRIVRFEEYADSAAAAPILAVLQPTPE